MIPPEGSLAQHFLVHTGGFDHNFDLQLHQPRRRGKSTSNKRLRMMSTFKTLIKHHMVVGATCVWRPYLVVCPNE